jgi:hypothetical protein
MNYTLTGQLTEIGNPQTISKDFYKRDIVVAEPNTNGLSYVILELHNGDMKKIDAFKVGDGVTVSFKISGRKYFPKNNGAAKYFNNLIATDVQTAEIVVINSTVQPETSFSHLKI